MLNFFLTKYYWKNTLEVKTYSKILIYIISIYIILHTDITLKELQTTYLPIRKSTL